MDEFSLIKRYFEQPSHSAVQGNDALLLGIGDDCAVLRIPAAKDLVFSIDTLVEGVHFPVEASAADIAWRLLGSAVSDLAAMGAEPNSFTLALTLPGMAPQWLEEFSLNLVTAAAKYQLTLAGGDTTKGPLALSVQVNGFVNQGAALLRSGAVEGDIVCVTGSLGDSKAGLGLLAKPPENQQQAYLLERYYRPLPRISSGLLINTFASACIDVSDGLIADLSHLLKRSGVSAKIDAQSIPLSQALLQEAGENALQWALTGGEDFELCFTLSAENWAALKLQHHDVALTAIGVITAGDESKIFQNNQWQPMVAKGYLHFSE